MKINAWMLCLAGGLAVATTLEAQGPGGGGGRGGRGGGFGMGGMGRGGILMIAGNEAVQKDIGLTEDGVAKVKSVTDEYQAAMRESFTQGGGGNFQDMTPEERRAAMEKRMEAGRALTAKFLPKIKEALKPDQYTRLQQINWQNMGTGAYADEEVVKALTITKEQTDKITALNEEYGAKMRELFQPGGGGGGGGGGFEKMQEMNKERDGKINEILTKAQLESFEKLKGKEFDVAQLRPRFGPGGPGGGGPGGGGGAGGRPKRPQPKPE
jgi:Spy/CpxP family protein refolding chaperone